MAIAPHNPAPSNSGSMLHSSQGTVYVSSGHWASILDSISETGERPGREEGVEEFPQPRDQLHNPPRHHAEPSLAEVPHLLSGLSRTPTKAEVLSAMPDQSIVDRHVYWYFKRLPLGMVTVRPRYPRFRNNTDLCNFSLHPYTVLSPTGMYAPLQMRPTSMNPFPCPFFSNVDTAACHGKGPSHSLFRRCVAADTSRNSMKLSGPGHPVPRSCGCLSSSVSCV